MHTLARPSVRVANLKRQAGTRAFTLIELLVVIAIIAILASITFGVIKGVNERAAIAQAKTEVAVLAQALEAFKKQYGDYPQTGGFTSAGINGTPTIGSITTASAQAKLFNALVGKLGPTCVVMKRPGGKMWVDISKFSLETTTMPAIEPTPITEDVTQAANAFLDPWGRRYMYYYKTAGSTTWKHPSYFLYSVGPDGQDTPPSATTITYTDTKNLDNLYANRN
ncbi:MAG: hypothetical protein K0R17_1002 [Rariglobus sp.]|jgi:prepilin-type N-terminal cleavage/methylation domain-containing protein|nr:hypothetical protein [Rariglobus sp.]